MKLSLLLKELQEDFELKEPFKELSSGSYHIPVEEGEGFDLRETPQGILLSTIVADLPHEKEEELYQHILSANLFGQGTKGSLLGITEDGRRLTLSHLIDYDVNFKDFQEIIDDFITTIDFWREEIHEV